MSHINSEDKEADHFALPYRSRQAGGGREQARPHSQQRSYPRRQDRARQDRARFFRSPLTNGSIACVSVCAFRRPRNTAEGRGVHKHILTISLVDLSRLFPSRSGTRGERDPVLRRLLSEGVTIEPNRRKGVVSS